MKELMSLKLKVYKEQEEKIMRRILTRDVQTDDIIVYGYELEKIAIQKNEILDLYLQHKKLKK